MNPSVSVVLTSCGRIDLLEKTIDSFFAMNTYPINQFILIDDSGQKNILLRLNQLILKYSFPIQLIFNEKNIGQIQSIDKAYEIVESEYVFHCEDDWEFFEKDFIEISLNILKSDPTVINVWLRSHEDTNGHPIDLSEKKITKDGIGYYLMKTGYLENWHGFVFNPSLKRMSDLRKFSPFSKLEVLIPKGKKRQLFIGEEDLSVYFFNAGYRGSITDRTAGFVKHIGQNRHLNLPWQTVPLVRKIKRKLKSLIF